MPRRTWTWTAVAFVVGAGLGAALLLGASTSREPAEALVVSITNVGTHASDVVITVGSDLARWRFVLDAGEARVERLADPPRAQIPIAVDVTWAAAADDGHGIHRAVADGRDCAGGQLLATFRVDTTIGVSFPTARTECRRT